MASSTTQQGAAGASQGFPTEHPHVERRPGICGGAPVVQGTRISVRHIAVLHKDGASVQEMLESYPHLQASWVHDAISYYLDHQEEIDREIEANRIEAVLARTGGGMDDKGVSSVFQPGAKPMSGDPLFIRLYLDEDFHPDLAAALRGHGHDCQSAVEAGRLGAMDEEPLTYAAAQGRCLRGFNVGDFAFLSVEWARVNRVHAGAEYRDRG